MKFISLFAVVVAITGALVQGCKTNNVEPDLQQQIAGYFRTKQPFLPGNTTLVGMRCNLLTPPQYGTAYLDPNCKKSYYMAKGSFEQGRETPDGNDFFSFEASNADKTQSYTISVQVKVRENFQCDATNAAGSNPIITTKILLDDQIDPLDFNQFPLATTTWGQQMIAKRYFYDIGNNRVHKYWPSFYRTLIDTHPTARWVGWNAAGAHSGNNGALSRISLAVVDNKPRFFHIAKFASPTQLNQPFAVIFNWHGAGHDISRQLAFIASGRSNVNGFVLEQPQRPAVANADRPYLLITPQSEFTSLTDFDATHSQRLDRTDQAVSNLEVRFFETILGCLRDRQDLLLDRSGNPIIHPVSIDSTRIYSVGFSAGGAVTAILNLHYPELVHTTAQYSGPWMNAHYRYYDPKLGAQQPAENWRTASAEQAITQGLLLKGTLDWGSPTLQDLQMDQTLNITNTHLLTHGGVGDTNATFSGMVPVIDIEEITKYSLPSLLRQGRTVIDCPHVKLHREHPDVDPFDIVTFLFKHQAGQPSPYRVEYNLSNEKFPIVNPVLTPEFSSADATIGSCYICPDPQLFASHAYLDASIDPGTPVPGYYPIRSCATEYLRSFDESSRSTGSPPVSDPAPL